MTLSELIAEVKERMQEETNSDRLPNSVVTSRLNQAQRFIARESGQPLQSQSGTTTASQANYSLNSDWFKTKSVRYGYGASDFRLLCFMPIDEYRSIRSVTTGLPTHYTVDLTTKEVLFWPTPSSSTDTYSMYYMPVITSMTADNDTPFNGDARMTQFDYDLIGLAVNYIIAKDTGRPPQEAEKAFAGTIAMIKRSLTGVETAMTASMESYENSGGGRARPVLPANYPKVW